MGLYSSLINKVKNIKPPRLKEYPVWWANFGIFSKYIASLLPTKSPPVVILSLPRSGSSWVGEVLSLPGESLYLREPLTRTYLDRNPGHPVLEITDNDPPDRYRKIAERIFTGLPTFPSTIVKHPSRWSIIDRPSKRIVVKEVNPLAGPWLVREYQTRVIYLIRHPAAVAKSFYELGWTEPKLNRDRFTEDTLSALSEDRKHISSFWEEMGIYQALLHELILGKRERQEYLIVRYEDLCVNPIKEFRKLYHYAKLEWKETIADNILSHSTAGGDHNIGEYGTYRNSKAMIEKWKQSMSKEEIAQVKKGYLSQHSLFYGEGEW